MRRRDKAAKAQRHKTLKRRNTVKVVHRRRPSVVNATERIALLTRERDKSLEQQIATSAILHVISNSPTNAEPVFDTIVECALKLFANAAVSIVLRDGDQVKAAAINEADPARAKAWRNKFPVPLTRQYLSGATILTRASWMFPIRAPRHPNLPPARRISATPGIRR